MAVLVLGGYGLIGSAIVERLLERGLPVIGLGRDVAQARRSWPTAEWRAADIGKLLSPEQWSPLLAGADCVVNAAGVLQQGLTDDVEAVQLRAMTALYAAAKTNGIGRVVQISAVGASAEASTEFLRTKARADEALSGSGLEFVILRPGLVMSPVAYGGTAMLRAVAAFPGLTPLVLGSAPVQVVWIGDVADAAVSAAQGETPSGGVADLVERSGRSLADTVALFRGWRGARPAIQLPLPEPMAHVVSRIADLLGWLGWRSPLRSTATTVLREGVTGDPQQATALLGRELRTLPQMLSMMPMGSQEHWFGRLWLLKPIVIGTLSVFWIASGTVGLLRKGVAMDVLTSRGIAHDLAGAAVVAGGLVDIALGVLVLCRPTAAFAMKAMLLTAFGYLLGASIFAPDLWLDPLGPLVKVVPAIVLALVGLAVLDER